MRFLRNPHTSLLTFEDLTEKQRRQLLEVFEKQPALISIPTSPAQNKVRKTGGYTCTFYIAAKDYLSVAETRILEELCLTNAQLRIYSDTGARAEASLAWCATHQMTLTDWLDTVGLLKKENPLKLNHH